MKPAVLTIATFAAACAGWWLPALWQKEAPRATGSLIPMLAEERSGVPAPPSLASKVRRAGSAMAQFQAVAEAFDGHGAALRYMKEGFTGFPCQEAEELAAKLAGAELARSAGEDGPAFLRAMSDLNNSAGFAAIDSWAAAHPVAALQAMLATPGTNWLYTNAFTTAARLNPEKALEILRATPANATMQQAWSVVLAASAQRDPEKAVQSLLVSPFSVRQSCASEILRALAAKDPQSALEWKQKLPPEFGHSLGASCYLQWARTDPGTAVADWLRTDPAGFKDNGENLVRQWAAKDPEAALRWGRENAGLVPSEWETVCVGAITAQDPQRALALLAETDEENRGGMVNRISQNWPGAKISEGVRWAASFTNTEDRDQALYEMCFTARHGSAEDRRAFIAAAGADSRAGFRMLLESDQSQALETFRTIPKERREELWGQVTGAYQSASPEAVAPYLKLLLTEPGGKDYTSITT
jgi:hypothetical protein